MAHEAAEEDDEMFFARFFVCAAVSSIQTIRLEPSYVLCQDGEEWACEVALISEVGPKLAIAVPGPCWHRRGAKRVLPRTALTRVTAIKVPACFMDQRSQLATETIRVWVGILDPDLEGLVSFVGPTPRYAFGRDGDGNSLIPEAEAVAKAANDLFQFMTAVSGAGGDGGGMGGLHKWMEWRL